MIVDGIEQLDWYFTLYHWTFLGGNSSCAEPSLDLFYFIDDMTTFFVLIIIYLYICTLYFIINYLYACLCMLFIIIHACSRVFTVCTCFCTFSERWRMIWVVTAMFADIYVGFCIILYCYRIFLYVYKWFELLL